jgi:hypothetical protein
METLEVEPEESPEDVQEAWLKESERRLAESGAGVPGIPAEEVWRRLEARLAGFTQHRQQEGEESAGDVRAAWLKECKRRLAASDAGEPDVAAEDLWRELAADRRGHAGSVDSSRRPT